MSYRNMSADKEVVSFEKCSVVLLDVAGTTTSNNFVKDTLISYAAENLEEYLKANWEEENVKATVKALKNDEELDIEKAISVFKELSKKDEDNEQVKTLQGLVCARGYETGSLKAHVFPDVPTALETWAKTKRVAIYSAGSVEVQKSLFAHTVEGDLLKHISAYFDLSIGSKTTSESYERIAKELSVGTQEIVYINDKVEEATAAKKTGITSVLVLREGNDSLKDEDKKDFTVLTSFADLSLNVSGKRKNEDTETAEVPPLKVAKIAAAVAAPETTELPIPETMEATSSERTGIEFSEKEDAVKIAGSKEEMESEAPGEPMEIDTPDLKLLEVKLAEPLPMEEDENSTPTTAHDNGTKETTKKIEKAVKSTEKVEEVIESSEKVEKEISDKIEEVNKTSQRVEEVKDTAEKIVEVKNTVVNVEEVKELMIKVEEVDTREKVGEAKNLIEKVEEVEEQPGNIKKVKETTENIEEVKKTTEIIENITETVEKIKDSANEESKVNTEVEPKPDVTELSDVNEKTIKAETTNATIKEPEKVDAKSEVKVAEIEVKPSEMEFVKAEGKTPADEKMSVEEAYQESNAETKRENGNVSIKQKEESLTTDAQQKSSNNIENKGVERTAESDRVFFKETEEIQDVVMEETTKEIKVDSVETKEEESTKNNLTKDDKEQTEASEEVKEEMEVTENVKVMETQIMEGIKEETKMIEKVQESTNTTEEIRTEAKMGKEITESTEMPDDVKEETKTPENTIKDETKMVEGIEEMKMVQEVKGEMEVTDEVKDVEKKKIDEVKVETETTDEVKTIEIKTTDEVKAIETNTTKEVNEKTETIDEITEPTKETDKIKEEIKTIETAETIEDKMDVNESESETKTESTSTQDTSTKLIEETNQEVSGDKVQESEEKENKSELANGSAEMDSEVTKNGDVEITATEEEIKIKKIEETAESTAVSVEV